MKNILLVCNAGMSTSLLVTKMQKYAEENGFDVKIEAQPLDAANRTIEREEVDVILLGPQVRFELNKYQTKYPDKKIAVIGMQDYGTMNGENVFKQALELYEAE